MIQPKVYMSNTETFLSFLITKLWQLRLYFYILLRHPKHLILLCLVFLSMSRTMADFPPNPEDGELWIPSDVLHEIVSTDIDDATYDHVGPVAIQPNLEVLHFSFFFSFFLFLIHLFFCHNSKYD